MTSPPDNPLGLNADDPNGQDDVVIEAADLHLPIGKPVKVLLRSIDVLHDFYVPEFRAKMDMIPGSVTYFWFTPTRTGTFEVLCAELCGADIRRCAASVIVERRRTTRPGSTNSRPSPNVTRRQVGAAELTGETPVPRSSERVARQRRQPTGRR